MSTRVWFCLHDFRAELEDCELSVFSSSVLLFSTETLVLVQELRFPGRRLGPRAASGDGCRATHELGRVRGPRAMAQRLPRHRLPRPSVRPVRCEGLVWGRGTESSKGASASSTFSHTLLPLRPGRGAGTAPPGLCERLHALRPAQRSASLQDGDPASGLCFSDPHLPEGVPPHRPALGPVISTHLF